MYKVKEVFYTLQGEGAHSGRAAVFCRFSKCNLWSGKEVSRKNAICNFCDTDFLGTDGQNGGVFESPALLAEHIDRLWPQDNPATKFVVCTGGEPLLQLDEPLIQALHHLGFEVAVETNGTLPAPKGLDWICVSPKSTAEVVITKCNELKLVYPQADAQPEKFEHIKADHYFISPLSSPTIISSDLIKESNTKKAIDYCLSHPKWKLSIQTHKILGID